MPARACDAADVGGKARTLARAARSGLAVPAFCVVSEHASGAGHRAPGEMDADLRRTIAAAIDQLSPDGCLLAVRSSGSDEDGSKHSFAGQFASFLNIAPEDAPDRVLDVWRSALSDHVAAYRREHVLGSGRLPAVILQRMLAPSVSGVAFSADPVSGRRGIAVVAAVRGLGHALVAGDVDADTWRVDREGEIVERQLMTSHGAGQSPVLSDDQVRNVAALARQASRLFGAPQDIEWAIDGGLLPVAVTPGDVAEDDGRSGWSACDLGQQQHRRKLQRRHAAIDVFVRARDLSARLPAVLPDDGRSCPRDQPARRDLRERARAGARPPLLQPLQLVSHPRAASGLPLQSRVHGADDGRERTAAGGTCRADRRRDARQAG